MKPAVLACLALPAVSLAQSCFGQNPGVRPAGVCPGLNQSLDSYCVCDSSGLNCHYQWLCAQPSSSSSGSWVDLLPKPPSQNPSEAAQEGARRALELQRMRLENERLQQSIELPKTPRPHPFTEPPHHASGASPGSDAAVSAPVPRTPAAGGATPDSWGWESLRHLKNVKAAVSMGDCPGLWLSFFGKAAQPQQEIEKRLKVAQLAVDPGPLSDSVLMSIYCVPITDWKPTVYVGYVRLQLMQLVQSITSRDLFAAVTWESGTRMICDSATCGEDVIGKTKDLVDQFLFDLTKARESVDPQRK